MKTSEQKFLSVALASLPLLGHADSFYSAFRIGVIVVLAFWLTVFFFKLTRPAFPTRLVGISLVLWIAFGAEAVTTYCGTLSPFWSLSLLVLLFPYLRRDLSLVPDNSWKKVAVWLFQKGAGFLILITYLGASREVFRKINVGFFDQPAGALFLLALAGWLVQNQPGVGRSIKQAANSEER